MMPTAARSLLLACLGACCALSAASAFAAPKEIVRTVCGVRTGTAGNAALSDNKGDDVIVLATQGGDQRLLNAADAMLPASKGEEAGTQNGQSYCLKVRYDAAGTPVKILAASRRK